MKRISTSLAAALLCTTAVAATAAKADVIVLDFEGVGNQQPVGDYYNGNGGPDYGIVFSPATLAIVDEDAGGDGNFANEPSPSTIMFFLDANNATLNVLNGFDVGFSFFYSSSVIATVTVWSGLDSTGDLLGSLDLNAQAFNDCAGDPEGDFCNWTAVGVAFDGIAHSINFGGTANFTGYDNITFGSVTPGGSGPGPVNPVPEPAALALLGLGLAGLGVARRRKSA